MLHLTHPRLWLVAGVVLLLVIVSGSLAPGEYLGPGLFRMSDKVNHALGYAGLTFWFTGIYPRSRYALIVLGLLLLGALLEAMQGAMSFGRVGDLADFVANSSGIGFGLLLALTWSGGWAQRVEARIHQFRNG